MIASDQACIRLASGHRSSRVMKNEVRGRDRITKTAGPQVFRGEKGLAERVFCPSLLLEIVSPGMRVIIFFASTIA